MVLKDRVRARVNGLGLMGFGLGLGFARVNPQP